MPCQCALRCVRSCLEQCTQVHRDKGAAQSHTCYGQCTRSCVPQCAAGSFELVEMGEQVESAAPTLQPYVASLQPYVAKPATLRIPACNPMYVSQVESAASMLRLSDPRALVLG